MLGHGSLSLQPPPTPTPCLQPVSCGSRGCVSYKTLEKLSANNGGSLCLPPFIWIFLWALGQPVGGLLRGSVLADQSVADNSVERTTVSLLVLLRGSGFGWLWQPPGDVCGENEPRLRLNSHVCRQRAHA